MHDVCRTADEALALVEAHGVMLVSAKGAVPNLADSIAGTPIKGSWWAHPQGRRIFALLRAVTESDQVLVCRLVDGKLTLVHRRLWPSLVRLESRFAPEQIAQVRQEHTPSGRHVNHETPYPLWVPAAVAEAAKDLSEEQAVASFGGLLSTLGSAPKKRRPAPRSPSTP